MLSNGTAQEPIAIGDTFKTTSNNYFYIFNAGITYQIPNAHLNVAVVVGDENANITITNPSTSSALTATVYGYKSDGTSGIAFQGRPSDFPITLTGYHTYVVNTAGNSLRYSFKVNY